jgi:PAS domain S-box-containing protein
MTILDNYQWLFRKAPTMVTLIGDEGRYLDVNDAFLERLGFTREEMIGRRPAEFVTESSAHRIESEFLPTLRRTGKLESKPITLRGSFVRIVAIYSEVADQAKANLKYRQLYRSTPAMLHTVDANGCIMAVTDHWLQKMAYSRDEVVGRPIVDFFSYVYRRKFAGDRLQEIIDGGEFKNEERQMVTKDGIVLDLLMSAISERDSSGRVQRMLVASKDVTKRNRAERALRKTLAENAHLREELERERDYLREEVNVAMNFGRIIGESPALKHMLDQLEAVAQTPASVLVLGESGVGKELVAHAIHARSPRADGPLVKVNCPSIPKDLFESEFFGHVKGAFTGAHRDRVGRFQLADGGTIFLDEVGEIPIELQGKLLRVLQESEFECVGDDITKSVDVRVIAATNRDLEQLVIAGKFREDLFYRLSVFPIDVPPLRKRGDDVIQLAQHFLEATCNEFGRKPMTLTRNQADEIRNYGWPGNVRELKNVIERAVILSQGNVLRLDLSLADTGAEIAAGPQNDDLATESLILTEKDMKILQKKNLLAALRQTNWRVSGKGGAAELLGVRPTTLADRIKSFGVRKPRHS